MRIIIILLFLANTALQAQVGIGTTNPDTKAALDISSNSKGLLTAISIKVRSIESASTSPSYMLTIYAGTPTPTCGYVGASPSSCAFSSFGAPLATSMVSINNTGINKLFLCTPLSLTADQMYTFSITPTTGTQMFNWDGQVTAYTGGNSYGLNGSIAGANDDYTFLTHYQVGWRAL